MNIKKHRLKRQLKEGADFEEKERIAKALGVRVVSLVRPARDSRDADVADVSKYRYHVNDDGSLTKVEI